MADEFEIQENPDNTPSAVSSGYQRQNTNSEISRQGLDNSSVVAGTINGDIDIEISGGVDVDGVMYSAKSVATLTVPSGTYYIKLTAGSTTDYLTPVVQAGAGTWDTSKNGFYDTGERVLDWVIISDGGTNENVIKNRSIAVDGILTDNIVLKTKVIEIGDWNMDTISSINVAHGLTSFKNIRSVSAIIRDDSDAFYYDINIISVGSTSPAGSFSTIAGTNIGLKRNTGGLFDDPAFNSTSFNRGWITIIYVA